MCEFDLTEESGLGEISLLPGYLRKKKDGIAEV